MAVGKNLFKKKDPNIFNILFQHFCSVGMDKHLKASFSFDPVAYRLRYGDLQILYGLNWHEYYKHFCRWGLNELRFGGTGFTSNSWYNGIQIYELKSEGEDLGYYCYSNETLDFKGTEYKTKLRNCRNGIVTVDIYTKTKNPVKCGVMKFEDHDNIPTGIQIGLLYIYWTNGKKFVGLFSNSDPGD